MFRDWQSSMGADAKIVAVRMPGRGNRREGDAPIGIDELADGVAAAIRASADWPICLFGHSLGALVAFEVARRLDDLPYLRHLVASGCGAPSLLPTQRAVQAAQLRGREFAEAIGFFGGFPPEVLADEELSGLLLPGLQADLRMAARYRYRPAAPLRTGVSLINGREDPHITDAALRPWRLECTDAPDYHWKDGGHFYFERRPLAVVEVLKYVIRADAGVSAGLGNQHIEVI